VLVTEPKYLVMDEPGSGLDPQGRDEIFSYVQRLHDESGVCVILVSHNMEDVARLVGRVIVLDDGKIRMDGAPEDVFTEIEVLEGAGLRAPDIQYLMRRLKTVAPDINTGAITARQAADEIEKLLRRAGIDAANPAATDLPCSADASAAVADPTGYPADADAIANSVSTSRAVPVGAETAGGAH
jgi:ABC-type multidrug transport system ATPase subunit